MAVLTAMLYERFKAGKYPIALVSMDNCSQNGARLRESVLIMAEEWRKTGFVGEDFVEFLVYFVSVSLSGFLRHLDPAVRHECTL